ncbi:hypothetical protein GOV06_01565 [Candidatus Woesearchaeota archaeon]|nr:hypothetical protein [Candidatus Woesearchaeota archaeon]
MEELSELAEDMLKHWNVSKRQKDYLMRRFSDAIESGYISSSEQIPDFLANWIDRLNTPYKETFGLRLDAELNKGSSRVGTYHSIIPATDLPPIELLIEKEEGRVGNFVSFEEAIEILGPRISTAHRKALEITLGENYLNTISDLTESEVIEHSDELIGRLDEVVARLYEHTILIPRITTVHFENGLLLVSYKGKLPSETTQAILNAHKEKLSAYKIAARTDVSDLTVLKIWRAAGLEPHFKQRGRRISEEQVTKIFEGHKKEWGMEKTAKYAGVSITTVFKYWLNKDLPVKTQDNTKPTKHNSTDGLKTEQIEEIVEAHPKYLGKVSEAARNLPYEEYTIAKYWDEAGLPRVRRKMTTEQIEEIIAAHSIYEGNVSQAERHIPYCRHTITKYWDKAGLPRNTKESLTAKQIKEVIAAHSKYKGNVFQVARHTPYGRHTITKYWDEAGLPRMTKGKTLEIRIKE